jgi:hypothetical protein
MMKRAEMKKIREDYSRKMRKLLFEDEAPLNI